MDIWWLILPNFTIFESEFGDFLGLNPNFNQFRVGSWWILDIWWLKLPKFINFESEFGDFGDRWWFKLDLLNQILTI